MMVPERPKFLSPFARTSAQRKALGELRRRVDAIVAADRDEKINELELHVAGIGCRSTSLFADRGLGKTSILLTLCQDLRVGNDCLPLWPPIDARGLDQSETVIGAVLARLSQLSSELEQPPEKRGESEGAAWRQLQHRAWQTHPLYARFVAASAASATEFAAYLVDRDGGTHRLRDLVTKQVKTLQGAAGGKHIVVFIDDLDQAPGRATEALIDLDRYLAVPGLVFVFAFRYETLWHQLSEGLFGDLEDWLKEAESNALARKLLPVDSRVDLWEVPPFERLRFGRRPNTVEALMRRALPEDAHYLFLGEAKPSLEGAAANAGIHADLLPAAPRDLRALLAMSRTLSKPTPAARHRDNAGSAASRIATEKVMRFVEGLARATDHYPAIRMVAQLRSVLDSRGAPTFANPDHSLASWIARVLRNYMAGAQSDPQRRLLDQRATYRDATTAVYAPLARLLDVEEQGGLSRRWQEFIWDLSMYLSPDLVWATYVSLRFPDDVGLRLFVPSPSEEPEPRYIKWFVRKEASPLMVGPAYHLDWLIAQAGEPCLPDLIRRQEAYVQALRAFHRPGVNAPRYLQHQQRGRESGAPDLRASLEEIACLHIAALLQAHDVYMLDAPYGTARSLAEHLPRALRHARFRVPSVANFLAQDGVRAVLRPSDHELLSAAWARHSL